jgi:BirA family biotin operon repressor/biotin-[acetyl-CoA-carboxylase] ligase
MTTRTEVLEALRAAGSAGISGETLGRQLGVSRVAVGKHVAALRAAGYEIEAEPGTGYRMLSVPDVPFPDEIRRLLTGGFWERLEGGAETGSTNDDARVLARAGAEEGTVVLAARQSAGRGRLGRTWVSPEGGAYVSAVLRPAVAPAEVASLSLAVALGAVLGLERLGVEPRLKWPNDVLFGGGKLAGVLLEMAAESDRVDWVVAGIGLNVRRPASGAPDGAAYLSDALGGVRMAEAVAVVLDGIAETYGRWRTDGFSVLRSEYEARSALLGLEACVRDIEGAVLAEGTVLGVDEFGRLLVSASGKTVEVSAGEVTLREP